MGKVRSSHDVRIINFRDESTCNQWHGGTIIYVDDSAYVRNFVTDTIACWPDTSIPIDQLIIDVQTDNGVGRLFFRHESMLDEYGQPKLGTKYRALVEALESADHAGRLPMVGAQLWVRWTNITPNGRKLWEVRYEDGVCK
jgi:hypothetical protein